MKTVIEMAREAGFTEHYGWDENFKHFAALVREDEREQHPNLNCKSVQKRLATSWGYELPVENNQDLVIAHMVGYEKGKDAGVLAEREACAKVCDEEAESWNEFDYACGEASAANKCAAAIRARGEK